MSKKHKTIGIAAILAIQCLLLGWLIFRYERIVSQGTEVRFPCQAYDPYDPFRGRYLNTRVEESVLWMKGVPTEEEYRHWNETRDLYARLEPRNDGTNLYRVAEVAKVPGKDGLWVKPEDTHIFSTPASEENSEKIEVQTDETPPVAIPPETVSPKKDLSVRVSFPSKLFVNEKLAPKAEKILRENTENAVAVYRAKNGEIVLTDIEIQGESILKLGK